MAEFPPDTSSTPSPAPARPPPVREDCWSEEATSTLIEAWGRRYLELNRGNLRQKQWQEVADAVNARHGHVKKARRTDVQCKNRIDTLKKKYKVEKARVLESGGVYRSTWPFFAPLDRLIANLPIKKVASSPIPSSPAIAASNSPAMAIANSAAAARSSSPAVANSAGNARSSSPMIANSAGNARSSPPMIANLAANARSIVNSMANANANAPSPAIARSNSAAIVNSAAMKRPLAAVTPFRAEESSYFRKNYSAIAAAAAAAESEDDEDEEEEVEEEEGEEEEEEVEEMRGGDAEGIRKLAKVIEKFGEVYARVEAEKQRQMIELEKQRMQFAKELECQRMQMMVEMQVQLEKIKRAKRSDDSNDMYS